MNAILKSFRLDLRRLTATGPISTLVIACIPIIYTVVFRTFLSGGRLDPLSDGFSGATVGMIVAFCVVFTSYPFIYEDQNDHRRINGIIPVSRASQVSGRYLLVGAIDLAGVLVLFICESITSMGTVSKSVPDTLVEAGLMVMFSVLVQAVLMPVMYRFSSAKTLQYVTLGFFVAVLIIIGLGMLLNRLGLMDPIVDVLSPALASIPIATVLGVAITAVFVATSYALARRIYDGKEL